MKQTRLATIDPPMEAWTTWAMIAVAAVMLELVGVAMQRRLCRRDDKAWLQTLRLTADPDRPHR